MNCKAVVFDLDGVICFTDKYHYMAWKELADRLGIYFDEVINNRLRGVSRMASLDIILERSDIIYSEEEKLAFSEEKNNRYRKLLANMSPADLTSEVRETLLELRRRGYLLAIGSSSKNAPFILGQLGLGNFFDAIADGTDITHSKPDPEVFVKGAQALGLPCEKCIVFEDSFSGVEAAHRGGMQAVGVGDPADLPEADTHIAGFAGLTPADLLNRL